MCVYFPWAEREKCLRIQVIAQRFQGVETIVSSATTSIKDTPASQVTELTDHTMWWKALDRAQGGRKYLQDSRGPGQVT